MTNASRWVAISAIAGLVLSGLFSVLAFRSEAYDRSPSPEEMWLFGEWAEREIRYRFLSTRFRALEENRRKLEAKARRVFWSLSGLAMIAFVVALAAIVDLART